MPLSSAPIGHRRFRITSGGLRIAIEVSLLVALGAHVAKFAGKPLLEVPEAMTETTPEKN